MEVMIYTSDYIIYDINNNIDKNIHRQEYYSNTNKNHIKSRIYESLNKRKDNYYIIPDKSRLVHEKYLLSYMSEVNVYYYNDLEETVPLSNESDISHNFESLNISNKIKAIEFIYNNKIHRDINDGPAILNFDINGNCIHIEYVKDGLIVNSFDKNDDLSKYNNIYVIENDDYSFKSLSYIN
jgi:hypothetical protein